jgi:hypothetical protein
LSIPLGKPAVANREGCSDISEQTLIVDAEFPVKKVFKPAAARKPEVSLFEIA